MTYKQTTKRYGQFGSRVSESRHYGVEAPVLKDDLTLWHSGSKIPKKTGIAYPVGDNAGTYFHKCTGTALMKNTLHQFLKTKKGERVMIPSFGVNLGAYFFENLREEDIIGIFDEISASFEEFFPYLTIVGVKINDLFHAPVRGGIAIADQFPQLRSKYSRVIDENNTFGDTISNSVTISIDLYHRDLDELFDVEVRV